MSDTAPPPLASSRTQRAFGAVMGCGMMGGFLGAGLLAMLLPLPARYEGFRSPIAVAMGVGSIVFFVLVGMIPMLIGGGDEAKRLDRLFGALGMAGADDPGHGRIYRGERDGRAAIAQAGTTGGNGFSRHAKASFSLGCDSGLRMLVGARGTPALNMARMGDRKHVVLMDRTHFDIRATHPPLARALADDPAWQAVEALLAGVADAPGVLMVEPDAIQLIVVGEGATHFDVPEVEALFAGLATVAAALERLGPATPPARGESVLALGHLTPTTQRWKQWAMSAGCLSLVVLAWLGWVAAVAVDAGLVP